MCGSGDCGHNGTEDPDGLDAQVAALLGAAGSLSAHAVLEADETLAPKVRTHWLYLRYQECGGWGGGCVVCGREWEAGPQ